MNDTYLTILNSYGDIVELDYQFDVPSIIDELKSLISGLMVLIIKKD